ncbi:MAG: hypothetical protein WCD18_14045 [Thermosynechococcaceae cyanobacterium]
MIALMDAIAKAKATNNLSPSKKRHSAKTGDPCEPEPYSPPNCISQTRLKSGTKAPSTTTQPESVGRAIAPQQELYHATQSHRHNDFARDS